MEILDQVQEVISMMIQWEHLTEVLEADLEGVEAEVDLLLEAVEGSEAIAGTISTGVEEAIEAIVETILIGVVEAIEETVSTEVEEVNMEADTEIECIF